MSVVERYKDCLWEVNYHNNKKYRVHFTIIDKDTSNQKSMIIVYNEKGKEIKKESKLFKKITEYCFRYLSDQTPGGMR